MDDDDDDLIILWLLRRRRRARKYPIHRYLPPVEHDKREWKLSAWGDEKVRQFCRYQYSVLLLVILANLISTCRFDRVDIYELCDRFELQYLRFDNRLNVSNELALCATLCRLSYPTRLVTLQELFHLDRTSLSRIINSTIEWITSRYRRMLRWHPSLQYSRIKEYRDHIEKLSDVDCIWGFIDGTFNPFCRPIQGQQSVYSGYKKLHGYKYQGVATPDGLILSIDGPWEGRRNDLAIARQSRLEARLRDVMHNHQDDTLYLYGDAAYKALSFVFGPYPGGRTLQGPQAEFNKQLSSVRISIEQCFGRTQNLFAINSFKYALKSGLQPVALYWEISVLLTNIYTCLHPSSNPVTTRFGIAPMSLAEYLSAEATDRYAVTGSVPPEDSMVYLAEVAASLSTSTPTLTTNTEATSTP